MIENRNSSLKLALVFSLLAPSLSGCAEIKKIISVFVNKQSSINTSEFDFVEMSSGEDVTCNIMGNKTVRCLGSSANGNLGRFYGAPNNSLKDIKQIALGKGFTCAIVGENSALKCFGLNDKGQLGNANQTASVDPVPVLDTDNNGLPIVDAREVTAGDNHACALLKSGRAICWGDHSFGQTGNPSVGSTVKTVVENQRTLIPFQGISSITAGGNSTCIIAKEDLSLFCFGEKFGVPPGNHWVPEKVEMVGGMDTLSQVKQVGLGNGFGCALSRSQVFCWGSNEYKQLGASIMATGSTKASAVEVRFPFKAPISKIISIAIGDKHACALHRDEGTVYCWGNNSFGQLGTTSTHGLPEQVAVGSNNLILKGAKFIASGRERSCIISRNDELYCWGNGANGILGNESTSTPYPIRVIDSNNDMITGSLSISIGYDHACVIGINKKLFCFGLNQSGQLGSRMIGGSTLKNVHGIDTYNQKTCAIYGDKNNIECFGGDELKAYDHVNGIAVGENHICIINSEHQVECIDYETKPSNHFIVQTDKNDPLKDIWKIRSREKLNCGITRENGEIWCWGDWKKNQWPTAKQLLFAGKPTIDFLQFSMNDDQICGIQGVNRSIYCTTDINFQPLSDENGKQLAGVLTLTGGKHHTCALNDRNQLFCWGNNEFGQLGNNTLKNFELPQRVIIKDESHRKITQVSAGNAHTCFTTETELSLFCFGKSFFNEGISTTPIEYPL